MTEEIKRIIEKLLSYDIENPKLFGVLISDVVFKKLDSAMILDNKGHSFLIHSSSHKFGDLYQKITKLLSVLSYLEANGLIYRQCDDNKDELTVFYEGSNDLKRTTDGHAFTLGNGNTLLCQDNKYQVASGQKIVLAECHNISALYKELCYYLQSFIYPANGLSDYVAHDYLSENDYESRKSLRISRFSVWVAVGIACISPLFSLWLGNLWGVTEIKDSQFRQFIQRTAIKDTVKNNRRDTIVKFDTVYIKK